MLARCCGDLFFSRWKQLTFAASMAELPAQGVRKLQMENSCKLYRSEAQGNHLACQFEVFTHWDPRVTQAEGHKHTNINWYPCRTNRRSARRRFSQNNSFQISSLALSFARSLALAQSLVDRFHLFGQSFQSWLDHRALHQSLQSMRQKRGKRWALGCVQESSVAQHVLLKYKHTCRYSENNRTWTVFPNVLNLSLRLY